MTSELSALKRLQNRSDPLSGKISMKGETERLLIVGKYRIIALHLENENKYFCEPTRPRQQVDIQFHQKEINSLLRDTLH